MEEIRFIDLFAGMGGFRLGMENACRRHDIKPICVLSSEIKEHAISVYSDNFSEIPEGDITKIDAKEIPDFDILLGGFPCQAFSSAGKRMGFQDTRGTLFFEIQRILEEKKPYGFILENVEGLVNHDKVDSKKEMGRTLETILDILNGLEYKVSYKVLNSKDFGLAQNRKRIFIVGTKDVKINLDNFDKTHIPLKKFLEQGKETMNTNLSNLLLSKYSPGDLYGKSIKDKRGGPNNIHSWDIGLKGEVSEDQKELLELLLRERRKKHWAEKKGIKWMDGMPLTEEEISTFFNHQNLHNMLEDLVEKGYLKHEHPKDLVSKKASDGTNTKLRDYKENAPKGYNIVAGKLSFEISKILHPEEHAPTLVATDLSKLAVIDGNGLRRLTMREGLNLFGYPEGFKINVDENKGYDLLGNTVAVPVVESIANKIIRNMNN